MEESSSENKATSVEETENASKFAAGGKKEEEEETMEVIDDLEEGSEGSNFSADEEFSDGDEVVGSVTPSSSASSKSESGNDNDYHIVRKLTYCKIPKINPSMYKPHKPPPPNS